MERGDIRIAVLRIEGTNCEDETVKAFKHLGVYCEVVHLKQFYSDMIRDEEQRNITDYDCLVFPGGFSAGDYIRAGAIFSARVKSVLQRDLEDFIREGYPILGICNGFQVLAELGVLPGLNEDKPIGEQEMALGINDSNRFECRASFLKHENKGKCVFTRELKKETVIFPVAHAEGKVTFLKGKEETYIEKLVENDQVVFRYVDPEGNYAGYPWNPNGSIYNIAGICNVKGNVFGLMPHPERVFFCYQHLELCKAEEGDGKAIFESVVRYLENF
jgi:phosphoribosylformylglycinamidine synthase